MGTSDSLLPPPPPIGQAEKPTWWQQHGTTAAWIALAVSAIGTFGNLGWNIYLHHAAAQATSSDEHINALIETKLTPAIRDVHIKFDEKFRVSDGKLDQLLQQMGDAQGQLKRMRTAVDEQGQRQQQLSAVNWVKGEPERILAIMRADIQEAQGNPQSLSAGQLQNIKMAAQIIPNSAVSYWRTVADIINYQSFQNQMNGLAPDPSTISSPCGDLTQRRPGITIRNNVFFGSANGCIIDLDRTTFSTMTFRNSVIRYAGGPVVLDHVTFINCRFLLELPATVQPKEPERDRLLLALLESTDLTSVTATTR